MLSKRFIVAAIGTALAAGLGTSYWTLRSSPAPDHQPVIDPAAFVGEISNKYLTLKPGKKFSFKNSNDSERGEIVVTHETKKIMGVTTTVVRATEWKDGVLKEDTRDWYAQDKDGNTWYFGEAVDNYADGKLKNHAGSWEAGVDGAKPGIIMLARPKVGDTYRQEYYEGKAEDMGTIVALGKRITTPAGTFDDCIQIKDWSRIEWASEYKFYCPAVGFLVREEPSWILGGWLGAVMELVGIAEEK